MLKQSMGAVGARQFESSIGIASQQAGESINIILVEDRLVATGEF